MNRISTAVAALLAALKNLTAPKSVDAITASLRKQVDQLEYVRARSIEQADRTAAQITALSAKRDGLEAEAIKAWRTANKFRTLLED